MPADVNEMTASTVPLLPPRLFPLPREATALAVFHLKNDQINDELGQLCCDIFNHVVEDGKTYPMEETYTLDTFRKYYFAQDVFLGFVTSTNEPIPDTGAPLPASANTLDAVLAGRSYAEALGGMYYIKPNYVGRSSHLCNAGFVVQPNQRGLKMGLALGRSFLHYGPQLGYRGSVFNLVYASNAASSAIWDRLGFTRVGVLPGAGRLKTGPDGSEEYSDAIIYYMSFLPKTQ